MRAPGFSSRIFAAEGERDDLGIDSEFADLTGDELGVLGTEIEDEDFLHVLILSDDSPVFQFGRGRRGNC